MTTQEKELKAEFEKHYLRFILEEYYQAVDEFLSDDYTPAEYERAKATLYEAQVSLTIHWLLTTT